MQEDGYRPLPAYIVLYNDMAAAVAPFLGEHGYHVEAEFLQNVFEEQSVMLYKLGRPAVRR